MACNGFNHDQNCNCGFIGHGGNNNGDRSKYKSIRTIVTKTGLNFPTYSSYVNPNARCPVCSARVFFYRSPYDGRVFFDPPLGKPWQKHPCTDNNNEVSVFMDSYNPKSFIGLKYADEYLMEKEKYYPFHFVNSSSGFKGYVLLDNNLVFPITLYHRDHLWSTNSSFFIKKIEEKLFEISYFELNNGQVIDRSLSAITK